MTTPNGGLPAARPFGQPGAADASSAPTATVDQDDDQDWLRELENGSGTDVPSSSTSAPIVPSTRVDQPNPDNPSAADRASSDTTSDQPGGEEASEDSSGDQPETPNAPKPSLAKLGWLKQFWADHAKHRRTDVPRRWQSWQFWLCLITFHKVNPGFSRKEGLLREKVELEKEIASFELVDWFVVTVLSIIGGIGKTMITAYLLRMFGIIRENDRGVGMDNNPDMGVFAQRMGIRPGIRLSLKRVYELREDLRTYSRTKRMIPFTHGAAVVGAEISDKDFYNHFTQEMFDAIVSIFKPITSGLIGDAGTGLLSTPISEAAIKRTDVAVIVADPSDDSRRAALRAHDSLASAGYYSMISNSIAVINRVKPGDDLADLHTDLDHLFRAVVEVPWDQYLSNRDNPVNLGKISLETRIAMLKVLRAVLQGIQAETSSSPAIPSDAVEAGSITHQGE
jgi:MinD-like ATPase involved in chromosome partitioning or flagellar assembly